MNEEKVKSLKVEVITSATTVGIKEAINNFLDNGVDLKLIDIKFTETDENYSALIIYWSF